LNDSLAGNPKDKMFNQQSCKWMEWKHQNQSEKPIGEDSQRGSPQIGSQESGDEKMKNLERFLNYSKPKSTWITCKG